MYKTVNKHKTRSKKKEILRVVFSLPHRRAAAAAQDFD